MNTNLTDPRPHLLDRIRAAVAAFRDPNGAFTRGMIAGVGAYPGIRAHVASR